MAFFSPFLVLLPEHQRSILHSTFISPGLNAVTYLLPIRIIVLFIAENRYNDIGAVLLLFNIQNWGLTRLSIG
jgi:hypothetical protein